MCRIIPRSILVISLAALSVTVGACANGASDDDLIGPAQAQDPANSKNAADNTNEKTSTLPPSSSSSNGEEQGAPSASPSNDTETPPAKESTKPPTTPPPPTNNETCDPNNETYAEAFIEALGSLDATPCPCSASECCYSAFIGGIALCVPK